jgi:hypothetical protein
MIFQYGEIIKSSAAVIEKIKEMIEQNVLEQKKQAQVAPVKEEVIHKQQ